jgi:WD40 repeat protein
MAVFRTGSMLAAGGVDGSVWLYEAATAGAGTPTRLLATLPHTQTDLIESAAFSPDGKTLVTGSDDGTLQVTDVSTPSAPRSLGAPVKSSGIAYVLAFSPDGTTLAAGTGTPNTVALWSLRDRARPTLLGPPTDGPILQVYSVNFAPDGKTLAVGSADRSVRLLDTSDGAHARWIGSPMLGAGDYVNGVTFAPSGRLLAAASGDGVVRLWDVADRAHPVLQAALTAGGEDSLYSVAFDRTRGRLAAGGIGATVLQWDLDPAAAKARVCGLAGAPVAEQEWSRYLPSVPYGTPCRP